MATPIHCFGELNFHVVVEFMHEFFLSCSGPQVVVEQSLVSLAAVLFFMCVPLAFHFYYHISTADLSQYPCIHGHSVTDINGS